MIEDRLASLYKERSSILNIVFVSENLLVCVVN